MSRELVAAFPTRTGVSRVLYTHPANCRATPSSPRCISSSSPRSAYSDPRSSPTNLKTRQHSASSVTGLCIPGGRLRNDLAIQIGSSFARSRIPLQSLCNMKPICSVLAGFPLKYLSCRAHPPPPPWQLPAANSRLGMRSIGPSFHCMRRRQPALLLFCAAKTPNCMPYHACSLKR